MNNQKPSSSAKPVPQTPSSSTQHGKTQVFILSPDILKKLGIASKIPNLVTATCTASNSQATVSSKNDNEEKNVKYKIPTNLNKDDKKVTEIKNLNEIKRYNHKDQSIQKKEDKRSTVPIIPILSTAKSIANESNSQPSISLGKDNINEEDNVKNKILTNLCKDNIKVTDIKYVNETKKFATLKQKENEDKLSINLTTAKSIQSVYSCPPFSSLKIDKDEEQHIINEVVTNLNKEDKVSEIKSTNDTEKCDVKESPPEQKEKEEKLNITSKTPILLTAKSIENVPKSQPNVSIKHDHINEKHDVKIKIVENLNTENEVSNNQDTNETKTRHLKDPPTQTKPEEKLNTTFKMPNLPTVKSVENISNSQSNISLKEDNIHANDNFTNKIVTNLNKDNTVSEIKNTIETKKCDHGDSSKQKEHEENSVKFKLISMLTAKLENEKLKTASNSSETKIDKQTINLNNQLKPKEGITKKLKQTKLFQYCIIKEKKKIQSETKNRETNLDTKEESNINKLDNQSETIHDHNDLQIHADCNLITQECKQIITNRTTDNTNTIEQSTSSLENTEKNNENETEYYGSNINMCEPNNENILKDMEDTIVYSTVTIEQSTSSLENTEKNNENETEDCGLNINMCEPNNDNISKDKEDIIVYSTVANIDKPVEHEKVDSGLESNVAKNNNEQLSNKSLVEKSTPKRTPKGMKKKLMEVNFSEDSETITLVRKSGRKRKLSTLHSDYITELKLHDGSSQKVPNRGRKSVDVKLKEICDQSTEKNADDLENSTFINKMLKTEQKKTTKEMSKIYDKNVENKTLDLHENFIEKSFKKSESESKSIFECNILNTVKEENQNIDQKCSNILRITNNKSMLINKNAIGLRNNTIQIKSNINTQQLTTTSHKSANDDNLACDTKVNNQFSPKNQIIILENILIKSPTTGDICNLNKETQNISNTTPMPILSKLLINNSDSNKSVSKKILMKQRVTTNVADTLANESLKVKSPIKTYSSKRKGRILSNTTCTENEIQSPKLNQTKSEVQYNNNINKLFVKEAEYPKKNLNKSKTEKFDLVHENKTDIKTVQIISFSEKERTSSEKLNAPILTLNASIVSTESETTQDIEAVNSMPEVLCKANTTTYEKTLFAINDNIRKYNISEKINLVENTKIELKSPQTISISERNKTNYEKLNTVTKASNNIITTELTNNQNIEESTKQKVIPISTTTTPVKITYKERSESDQLENIQEPKKVLIYDAGIVCSDSIKDVNMKHEILNTLGITPSFRTGGIQTKSIKKSEILLHSQTSNVGTKVDKNSKEVKQVLTVPEKITPSTMLSSGAGPIIKYLPTSSTEYVDVKQELITITAPSTPLIRKRGRPAKKKNAFEPEMLQSSTVSTKIESNESTMNIKDEILIHAETTIPTRKRGRKAKCIIESGEESLAVKDKKRKREDFEDETTTISKDATCGVCNEVVDKANWNHHAAKHNFLCWKVGQPVLDLNDRKEVEYILYKAVKTSKFKQFTCPHCDDKKKSVLGFLAHIDMCQLTDEERLSRMFTCSVCNKKILPQSMKSHMKIHEDKCSIRQESIISQNSTENLNVSRMKRRAAAKAANLIQEVTSQEIVTSNASKEFTSGKKSYKKASDPGSVFITFGVIKKFQTDFTSVSKKCRFENCTFECNDFEEMKKHLNTCPTVNTNDYICRFCLHVESDENTIKKHVQDNHVNVDKKEEYDDDVSGNESYEDDDDEFDENGQIDEGDNRVKRTMKPSSEFKPVYKVTFLTYDRRVNDPISSYLPAIRWTYEFRQKNYSEYIFDHIKCLSSNWILMSSREHEKYLPRLKKSMSVKTYSIAHKIPNLQKKEHDWKQYNLYESAVENDTTTIFCGGPIWALAWVPTPLNSICDQYLAVSLQKDFETTYRLSESPSGHELIQFWNFGALQSKKKTPLPPPILEFSIAHNHGMIWCMEWCPSGFYDTEDPSNRNEYKKLGLLALACSAGTVPIYAIGIPHKKDNIKNNIFQVKPVYKLILQDSDENLLGQWKYQATKISWSKNSGHNVIAGGFSNGMVCLWDLNHASPLLKSEDDGIIILKPTLSFQAHFSAVSALILYPLVDKGRRWLLTGSWDRNLKYWDLNNISAPISTFGKRGFITDGVWLPHWLCSFFSFDDIFNYGHNVTTVQSPRDFGFKQCSALASNSVVMSISGNDWASAIAQGSLAGELSTTFPRTMLLSYDVDKHLKCKRMLLSYNDIIDKTRDVSERKNIMKSEKKSEQNLNDGDDKLFSQYLANSGSKESYVEEPTTYESAREKYGMLFCDLKLDHFNSLPGESLEMVRQSSRLHEVPTELYPFTSLNKVVWNPNKQAYLHVVCGYQSGFVRLRCIRFMNTNRMSNFL